MGAAGDGAAVVAHALAAEVGWPVVEWPDPHALHATIARTLGRREHLVVASAPLTPGEQERARGDLHLVRFVQVADYRGTPDEIARAIGREFGL